MRHGARLLLANLDPNDPLSPSQVMGYQERAALRELENASLVQQHVPGRYGMHDLLRLYANDTVHQDLTEHERESALRRVLDFYIHTAQTAARLLYPYAQQIHLDLPTPGVRPLPVADVAAAMAWFDIEHRVLLAAQHTAVIQAWHTTVWQLAWALDTFHARRGRRHDRLAMWQTALDSTTHLPDTSQRVFTHRLLGHAYTDLGQPQEGIDHLHQALTLAVEYHGSYQQIRVHRSLSWAWERHGDDGKALEHATCALNIVRTMDQPVGEAEALNQVGWCAARLGEYDTARTHCEAALTLHQHHRNLEGEATTLGNLGYIAHHAGHYERALAYYRRSLERLGEVNDTYHAALALDWMGQTHATLGQQEQARQAWSGALRLYQEQHRDTDAARVQQQLVELNQQDDPTNPAS